MFLWKETPMVKSVSRGGRRSLVRVYARREKRVVVNFSDPCPRMGTLVFICKALSVEQVGSASHARRDVTCQSHLSTAYQGMQSRKSQMSGMSLWLSEMAPRLSTEASRMFSTTTTMCYSREDTSPSNFRPSERKQRFPNNEKFAEREYFTN